jgi:hypothetical protein
MLYLSLSPLSLYRKQAKNGSKKKNRLRTEPDHEKGTTQTNHQRTNARPLAHAAGWFCCSASRIARVSVELRALPAHHVLSLADSRNAHREELTAPTARRRLRFSFVRCEELATKTLCCCQEAGAPPRTRFTWPLFLGGPPRWPLACYRQNGLHWHEWAGSPRSYGAEWAERSSASRLDQESAHCLERSGASKIAGAEGCRTVPNISTAARRGQWEKAGYLKPNFPCIWNLRRKYIPE